MSPSLTSGINRVLVTGGAGFIGGALERHQLLQAVRAHWEALPSERQERFRLHHISTDQVFGSLGARAVSRKSPLTTPAPPTRPARPPATIWCVPGTTPTGCRW